MSPWLATIGGASFILQKNIGIRLDHENPLRCEITCCNLKLCLLRARAPKSCTVRRI